MPRPKNAKKQTRKTQKTQAQKSGLLAPRRSLEQVYEDEKTRSHPHGGTSLLKHAKEMAHKKTSGNRMAGWKVDAPRPGKERQELFNECGQDCFLEPVKYGPRGAPILKFPICRRITRSQTAAHEKKVECRPDSRGIAAAYVRARQWGYQAVATKAKSLLEKYKIPKQVPPQKTKTTKEKTEQWADYKSDDFAVRKSRRLQGYSA